MAMVIIKAMMEPQDKGSEWRCESISWPSSRTCTGEYNGVDMIIMTKIVSVMMMMIAMMDECQQQLCQE